MDWATGQLEIRKQQIFLTPLKGLDETFAQEYQKGEIAGIALFKEIVDIQIKTLSDDIDDKLKELDNASRSNTDTSTSSDE